MMSWDVVQRMIPNAGATHYCCVCRCKWRKEANGSWTPASTQTKPCSLCNNTRTLLQVVRPIP